MLQYLKMCDLLIIQSDLLIIISCDHFSSGFHPMHSDDDEGKKGADNQPKMGWGDMNMKYYI